LSSLGLPFDPYDHIPLPSRILTTGAAANFPSVANLVGDIFNAPVFVPNTQVDSAQVVPHRNAPAQGFVARAALGSSYVARWIWGKEWGAGGLSVFEDEMKRLLGKRWVATGGMPLRTNVNAPGVVLAGLNIGGGSGANSGSSTPYGPRSGLGATVFVEEEEDEELERERQRQNDRSVLGALSPGVIGSLYPPSSFGDVGYGARMRTQTNSTLESLSTTTSGPLPSTAYTSPDLNLGVVGSGAAANGSVMTPTTPTPLTPVVALPTADAEAQIGLAKVAEPDLDAFMAYAAIVPEYCRLEGMMIKGIV
jgi:xylulokinase